MPRYEVRLFSRWSDESRDIVIDAVDDVEALTLARIHAMMTGRADRASVHRSGLEICQLQRDASTDSFVEMAV